MFKLDCLIISHTKVLKLCFCKCTNYLLFLSHSTYFYSLFPLLYENYHPDSPRSHPPTPRLPTLIPHICIPIPRICTPIPPIPIIYILISGIPSLISHIPIIALILFPDFLFRLLQLPYWHIDLFERKCRKWYKIRTMLI